MQFFYSNIFYLGQTNLINYWWFSSFIPAMANLIYFCWSTSIKSLLPICPLYLPWLQSFIQTSLLIFNLICIFFSFDPIFVNDFRFTVQIHGLAFAIMPLLMQKQCFENLYFLVCIQFHDSFLQILKYVLELLRVAQV